VRIVRTFEPFPATRVEQTRAPRQLAHFAGETLRLSIREKVDSLKIASGALYGTLFLRLIGRTRGKNSQPRGAYLAYRSIFFG
jgi:hypothetical protein